VISDQVPCFLELLYVRDLVIPSESACFRSTGSSGIEASRHCRATSQTTDKSRQKVCCYTDRMNVADGEFASGCTYYSRFIVLDIGGTEFCTFQQWARSRITAYLRTLGCHIKPVSRSLCWFNTLGSTSTESMSGFFHRGARTSQDCEFVSMRVKLAF